MEIYPTCTFTNASNTKIKWGSATALRRKKYFDTTNSSHNYPETFNLLDQESYFNILDEVCVSDIINVRAKKGWLY